MEQEGYRSERAAAHPCPVPLCLSLASSRPEEWGLEVQSRGPAPVHVGSSWVEAVGLH